MDLEQAVNQFRQLLLNVNPDAKMQFLLWLKENIDAECSGGDFGFGPGGPVMVILNAIREDIRKTIPLSAVLPSESMHFPHVGRNSDLDPKTTVHVDAFLYDDDTIDDLCEKGEMSRSFCMDCSSRRVKPLDFITHSMSVTQLQYLFRFLLPNLTGKTVLDVGSRTGAVLYSAFLFSSAQNIVGVELNKDFCQLQADIVEKYNMQDRVKVIHNDVMNIPEQLQASDVIIIYNAFEFFLSKEGLERMWLFLSQTIRKPGSLLVTSPSVEESLSSLQVDVDLEQWLRPLPVMQALDSAKACLLKDDEDCDVEMSDIHMYEVLPRPTSDQPVVKPL